MPILNDGEITRRIEELFPEHHEVMDLEQQVQPASVDLRLGNVFWMYKNKVNKHLRPINPLRDDAAKVMRKVTKTKDDPYLLYPGHEYFVIGMTDEIVSVPDDLVGRVDGRSSLGRLGLRVHSTAGFIDPGFTGRVTLEIDAVGSYPLWLIPGMRVCQISFETMTSPAVRPYGESRGSKYVGKASREAQVSLSSKDPEGGSNV